VTSALTSSAVRGRRQARSPKAVTIEVRHAASADEHVTMRARRVGSANAAAASDSAVVSYCSNLASFQVWPSPMTS